MDLPRFNFINSLHIAISRSWLGFVYLFWTISLGPSGSGPLAFHGLASGYFSQDYSSSPTFYVDNGLQQTIVLERDLSHRQKKEIRKEILGLLGLDRRPRPVRHPEYSSAPSYMMDLYHNLVTEDEVEEEVDRHDQGGRQGLRGRRLEDRLRRHNLTLPGMEQRAEQADIIMSFVNHAPLTEVDQRLQFDLSEARPGAEVTGAELRVYKRRTPSDQAGRAPFTLHVYRADGPLGNRLHTVELEGTLPLSAHAHGWVELDVTRSANKWTRHPASNHGLLIRLTDRLGEELPPASVGLMVDAGHRRKMEPFLVTMFRAPPEEQRSRARRSAGDQAKRRRRRRRKEEGEERPEGNAGRQVQRQPEGGARRQKERHTEGGGLDQPLGDDPYANLNAWNAKKRINRRACQRQMLHVKFRDLGWADWIIAPEHYKAYYCDGECSFPLNAHMNATNHAIVQALVHLMNPFAVPRPCCAPTKLSAISVLYFDDNSNVILKRYHHMVVKACGCH